MNPIPQEDFLGCGLACIAFLTNRSYKETRDSFKGGVFRAQNKGFGLGALKDELNRCGLNYVWKQYKNEFCEKLNVSGTIVYCEPNERYPRGHYVVALGENKYMNSWINFPDIPAKAGFETGILLIGEPRYVIFSEEQI
jgi:hypothetical protein